MDIIILSVWLYIEMYAVVDIKYYKIYTIWGSWKWKVIGHLRIMKTTWYTAGGCRTQYKLQLYCPIT